MARAVKVGEFQSMQRDDTDTIDPAAEDAAATERLRAIGSPINGNGAESALFAEQTADQEAGYDGPPVETPAEPVPDAMTRLVAREMPLLNVGAVCTAEMSLHMITERVRDAVVATDWGKLATDAEIVAEAERIWVSLDRQRSHTYSVEQDGSVRDWRRPDLTPDRGDVTSLSTIADDEPRFSGGGDGQAQQASMFLVPADKDFNGKAFREAPELAMLAGDLMERHGFLQKLEHCDLRYFWKRKTGLSHKRRISGGKDRGSGLFGHLLGAEFAIWLAADTARELKHTDRRIERSLFRQLLRIGQDDKGNWIEVAPELNLFLAEVTHYADVGDDDLTVGHKTFAAAAQMGLFADGTDDESPEDDGAGVLIHADGTALTADEIEAMERHELQDSAAEMLDDDEQTEAYLAQLGDDGLSDEQPNLTAQLAASEDEDILADDPI